MFLIKLNKWIVSLAILAGVVAFSGYGESQIKTASNLTELIIENPISKSSIFYFNTINIVSSPLDYYEFSFQSLLKNHNLKAGLQVKTNSFICLQYMNTFRTKLLLNSLKKDDYHDIFIG
ncbi:MAG: hypothetical protein KJN66_02780 [Bacteroidia bacterium]|nr:hypothetical protein [Bacteroidia bacterium]